MRRRPLLAANWKMNPRTADEAVELARGVREAAAARASALEVALFTPFPWLVPVSGELAGGALSLGAQDCYWEPEGAFTGEVSAAMLAGLCHWVINGHSERRRLFGETDETVARRAAAALGVGLSVIVCVGEGEDEHLAGKAEEVVRAQVKACLGPLDGVARDALVIAYEPIWAIGTGRNADPEHVAGIMSLIRGEVAQVLGSGQAAATRVLYGGSVKAGNVDGYVQLEDCDGCLVGGASLQAAEFTRMIEVVAERYES